jgi:hypothetical protein
MFYRFYGNKCFAATRGRADDGVLALKCGFYKLNLVVA